VPKKLIEVALPLDVINREAAREKSIRHGHPSTLHLWWARRPLAACRAVLFAQLVDDPSARPDRFPTEDAQDAERLRLFGIIERLVPWEASTDETVLEEARAEIRRCYPDGPPPVVDPFCGGGSIPLEAQRLGLEAHASDLNPVAVLITKALIELPPRFADRPPVRPDDTGRLKVSHSWKGAAGLAEDVRWYANWMRQEAERRIGHLYPKATLPDGTQATVIAWIWARTVTCPNPACRATMPLVRSFWLGKKKGKEAWVNPVPDRNGKRVRFEISHGKDGPPVEGTVGRAGATCLVCDTPVPLAHVRAEGKAGRMGSQLMAIVAEGHRQRIYLPPDTAHEAAADVPRPDDVPDTELAHDPRNVWCVNYGMTQHADLFTNRQLTALCTLSDLIMEGRGKVLSDSCGDTGYADAVATYLAFAVDRVANELSTICTWASDASKEHVRSTFARQAIPMTWDFAEPCPFGDSTGGIAPSFDRVAAALVAAGAVPGQAVQRDSVWDSPNSGATISTDPPYYDNVSYANLSDFFYVWLRRSLRGAYSDLLATVLTPKAAELVADPYRFGGDRKKAERFFEDGFESSFARLAKAAHPDLPLTVYYAFKQSEEDEHGMASTGWETMLSGMLRAGLAVTATWPMRTERSGRLRDTGSNALASSIVLACRPRHPDAGITDRRGFQRALKARLAGDLHLLQSGGVAPVDLAQAAIGPGMAVFSAYAKVVEADGSAMSVRTALALINQVLDEVTAEQEGEFDEDTRWAVAWYGEHGMDVGPYGRADDLSRAKNVSVAGLVKAGIVESGGGKVRLLNRHQLAADWDPATDQRLTVWEVTQHLIRRLLDEGEDSAADLLARVGGLGDAARDLAYRLYLVADGKRWAKEAGAYNALGAAWPEISRRATDGPRGQGALL
jgi:putative DNA methylase